MLTPAARANKLFGSDGGVALTLYPTFPEDFNPATPLFARIDALDVPLYCDQFERRGKRGALVHFADIDTERRASELVSMELYIEQTESIDAEEDDTFYMEDLIGFHIEVDEHTGLVTDYIDSEVNPLFEIEINGHKVLIPAVEEFIAHIDFENCKIKFTLPEGLIELNIKQ